MSQVPARSGVRQVAWSVGGLVAVLGVMLALPGQLSAQDELTFAKDIAPILQENCQACHRPGAIGPMALLTYEQVRPWAALIKDRVVEREMPPYHYDTHVGIQDLQFDQRLHDDDIRKVVAWVDAGAPLGDPADLPPDVEFPPMGAWSLLTHFGRPPDLVLASEPFDVPAAGGDLWWEPLVKIPLDVDRYIIGVEVKPSVQGYAVNHHANTTLYRPDEDGQLTAQGSARFTEYAMGKLGEVVPAGAGRLLPADGYVRWAIHYYPMGSEVKAEVTELGFWLMPVGEEPEYEQTLGSYRLDGDIDLLPHSTAMTQGFHSWDHPVRIDSFQPHGHLRLTGKSLEIYHPDTGERELVSMVSKWNPGWHLSHMYEPSAAPLVPVGSVMIVTAWYDNTENNPFNPDPDQFVGLGSRTGDEMSHAWIAVTHLDQEGYERILAEREQREREIASREDD